LIRKPFRRPVRVRTGRRTSRRGRRRRACRAAGRCGGPARARRGGLLTGDEAVVGAAWQGGGDGAELCRGGGHGERFSFLGLVGGLGMSRWWRGDWSLLVGYDSFSGGAAALPVEGPDDVVGVGVVPGRAAHRVNDVR
jgi:hypothetical protein